MCCGPCSCWSVTRCWTRPTSGARRRPRVPRPARAGPRRCCATQRRRPRGRLHERYQRLLLDEFQDTDPIQIELAVLHRARRSRGDRRRRGTDVDVDAGPAVLRRRPEAVDLPLPPGRHRACSSRPRPLRPRSVVGRLTTNFRTVRPVLELGQRRLRRESMAEEHQDAQPRYEPLDAAARRRTWASTTEPCCSVGRHRRAEGEGRAAVRGGRGHRRRCAPSPTSALAPTVGRCMTSGAANGGRRDRRRRHASCFRPRTSLPYLRTALEYQDDPVPPGHGHARLRHAGGARCHLGRARHRRPERPTELGRGAALAVVSPAPMSTCSRSAPAGGRWDIRRAPPETVPAEHPVRKAIDAPPLAVRDERWWLTPAALLERLLARARRVPARPRATAARPRSGGASAS